MNRVRPGRIVRDQAGFTLIELLAVAIILILLFVMAMPVYADVTDRSRLGTSAADLRTIEVALERHKAEKGHYPDRLQELVTQGYIKADFSFESPWSPGDDDAIYFFYAIDRAGRPQAYILADPGPNALNCSSEENNRYLYADSAKPFPCGRDPKAEARHWTGSETLKLRFSPIPPPEGTHPKNFRHPCSGTGKQDVAMTVQCTYRAES